MSILAGLALIYLPIVFAALGFWLCVRRLVQFWDGRDVMARFRPERRHVNFTENLLRVRVLRGWVSDE